MCLSNEKATKSHRYYDYKFARYVEEKVALVFIVTLQGISCYFPIHSFCPTRQAAKHQGIECQFILNTANALDLRLL